MKIPSSKTPRVLPTRLLSDIGSTILIVMAFVLAGCDSNGTLVEESSDPVSVGFSLASSTGDAAKGSQSSAISTLTLQGTNGTLTIDGIQIVMSEFELEGDNSGEFEAGPALIDIPLDATVIEPVVSDLIPEGVYNELEFEVEDVEFEGEEDDESDEAERLELEALWAEIQTLFPDWPQGASMMAEGTFTPADGGDSKAFRTYFEAEIEVEIDLSPPLEITAEGISRELVVRLDPVPWFIRGDGSVWNLSDENYADTQSLVEFEAEFENDSFEVEVDDD
ncbi:MAG: hypothetical protein HKN17_06135 [Rhodothermales bacterium]|nr:hypothetical protein [Rhodothermales bacterium]